VGRSLFILFYFIISISPTVPRNTAVVTIYPNHERLADSPGLASRSILPPSLPWSSLPSRCAWWWALKACLSVCMYQSLSVTAARSVLPPGVSVRIRNTIQYDTRILMGSLANYSSIYINLFPLLCHTQSMYVHIGTLQTQSVQCGATLRWTLYYRRSRTSSWKYALILTRDAPAGGDGVYSLLDVGSVILHRGWGGYTHCGISRSWPMDSLVGRF
jgi:hypothetical protein